MRTRTDDMMAFTKQKSALLIAGPTASGKSALAVRLAKDRDGVVINADALQVYRELDVLSARPSVEEVTTIPHRLYGHVSGAIPYSVAAWLADVTAEIETIWAIGKLPIIVGGTGLYFMALEQGLASVPPIDPKVREKWRGFDGDIHGELFFRDPTHAAKLKPNDRQRIARALEVIESTGQSLLNWQAQAQHAAFLKDVHVERMMVEVPRAELYERADKRFDLMVANGALEEVRAILDWDPTLPMMRAIGVSELMRYFRGELTLGDACALAKIATRQFIKRQLTWGRGQAGDWQRVSPQGEKIVVQTIMNYQVRSSELPQTTQAAEGLPRRRFTLVEVEALTEAGILPAHERYELIGGEIVPMSPKGNRHELVKIALNRFWIKRLPDHLHLAPETTLRINADTFHEPDFVFYKDADGLAGLKADKVQLAVEVSDTSLAFDLHRKVQLYAVYGIKEVWVIDVNRMIIHVHRKPNTERYTEVLQVNADEEAAPLFAPELAVKLSALKLI